MFREVTLQTATDSYVYREEDKIGEGGFGTVYRGQGVQDGRTVAIKRPHFYSDEALRKFKNKDCRYLPQLRHTYIVAVMAVLTEVKNAQGETGPPALIMEHVDGKSLDASWAEHIRFFSNVQKLELFHKICQGVAFAHSRGIIHRDLKPGNILLDAAKNPKIIDFGLAASLKPEQIRSLSHSHQFMGTLLYMAPEQYEAQAVDERADIYSLGLLLFFIFTGWHAKALLLKGEDTLMQMFDKYLPMEVAQLARKMCELDRNKRARALSELLVHIDHLLHHSLAQPVSLLAPKYWQIYHLNGWRRSFYAQNTGVLWSVGAMAGLLAQQLLHPGRSWHVLCLSLAAMWSILVWLGNLPRPHARVCIAGSHLMVSALAAMLAAAALAASHLWFLAAGVICAASTAVWIHRLYREIVG